MGVVFPMMNFLTVPMLKKQLHSRQAEIDRTHIVVTFGEEEVVYENLTVKPEEVKPVEEVVENSEETPVEKPAEEKVFRLNYQNFLAVKETKNLFLFYLDRQTVIILPKSTYVTVGEFDEFKAFILTKVNPRRVKFVK